MASYDDDYSMAWNSVNYVIHASEMGFAVPLPPLEDECCAVPPSPLVIEDDYDDCDLVDAGYALASRLRDASVERMPSIKEETTGVLSANLPTAKGTLGRVIRRILCGPKF